MATTKPVIFLAALAATAITLAGCAHRADTPAPSPVPSAEARQAMRQDMKPPSASTPPKP